MSSMYTPQRAPQLPIEVRQQQTKKTGESIPGLVMPLIVKATLPALTAAPAIVIVTIELLLATVLAALRPVRDDIVLASTPKPVGNRTVSLPPIGILVLVVNVTATEPLLPAVRLWGTTVEADNVWTVNVVPEQLPVSSGMP